MGQRSALPLSAAIIETAPVPTAIARNTDRELVELCLEGDEGAWTALLERYGGLIHSIAWKAKLGPEDVADVFQSVCMIMLKGLKSLRDESKLSSWITTITLRQCQRAKQRYHSNVVDFGRVEEELATICDGALLPDEEIQRLEQERLVRQALSMMEEPCRRLLTCLFYEKELWSYEEIANELGLSVATIGPKRSRCLKKFLEILDSLKVAIPQSEF